MTLFDTVKDLEYIGSRLSGDAEVIHEIEHYFRMPENFFEIIRPQITKILELVPEVFPENWKSPNTYAELNQREKEAFQDIAQAGIRKLPGLVVEKVIELAVEFRKEPRALFML